MTTAQIQSYAMDRIGYGPESEFDLTSHLAFADERDTWTVRACLEQLVSDAPAARERAERVWRWDALSKVVEALEDAWAEAERLGNTPDDWYRVDVAVINVWSDLRDFWADKCFPAEQFPSVQDWEPYEGVDEWEWAGRVLAENHRFLEAEAEALRSASL